MEYAYAVLILNESGEELNETNITAVLEAAGVEVETSRVKALVAALEGVDLDAAVEDVDLGASPDADRETAADDAGPDATSDEGDVASDTGGSTGVATGDAQAGDQGADVPAILAIEGDGGDGEGGEHTSDVEGEPSSQERTGEA